MKGNIKDISHEKAYDLIGLLIREMRSRRFAYGTSRDYIRVIKDYLRSGKEPDEFLKEFSQRTVPGIVTANLAVKLFHEQVLPKFPGKYYFSS